MWSLPLSSGLLITLSLKALVKSVTSPLAVSASGTRGSGQGPTRPFAFAIAAFFASRAALLAASRAVAAAGWLAL